MDKATEELIEQRAKIRDQFATAIMASLMAQHDHSDTEVGEAREFGPDDFLPEAMIAYKAALAMMAVRAKWISYDEDDVSNGRDIAKHGAESGMSP